MAQIQVITISTTILDKIWENMHLDNNGELYRKAILNEFTETLTKSLATYNRTIQIKWEVSESSNEPIVEFAQAHNIINKF